MSRSQRNCIHADRIIQKEKEYQNEIREISVHHKMLAENMAIDGLVQESCERALQDSPTDAREFETFLQVHREKSKALAESHVALKRKASAFINAMKLVKTDIQNSGEQKDYEVVLRTKMEEQLQAVNVQQGDCKNDKVYKDILEALKESNPDEEEDEDIAFMDGGEQEATYKCPILTGFMTKPMRNTICGHVYDNEGIRSWYKTKRICPLSGCGKPFTWNDLEDDVEMAMKLRRFHKRKQAEKKRRDAMTQDLDDDDDDNELDQKPTTTILE